jgi:hypothetical protein
MQGLRIGANYIRNAPQIVGGMYSMWQVSGRFPIRWESAGRVLGQGAVVGAAVGVGAKIIYDMEMATIANNEYADDGEVAIGDWNTVLNYGENEGRKVAERMLRLARPKLCPHGLAAGGQQKLSSCESRFISDISAAYGLGRALAREASSAENSGVDYENVFIRVASPKAVRAVGRFETCIANNVCNCCPSGKK